MAIGRRLLLGPCAHLRGTRLLCNGSTTSVAGTEGENKQSSFNEARPPTQRQLYEAAIALPDGSKKRAQAIGASFTLVGVGILAWQNWAMIAAYATWNSLGGGLMIIGLACAGSVGGMRRSFRGDKKAQSKFKLTLLNDSERWRADKKALSDLLGEKTWPSPELAKASLAEGQVRTDAIRQALQERAVAVRAALAAGEPASLVQARMRPRTFVFDFNASPPTEVARGGGIKRQLNDLRESVTFILACATPYDEVVLRLKSPGGGVSDYGLAASQLLRIRTQKIPFTVCIDTIAASGGYMMASTADRIVAAPFSMVGSIGVIAMMPNFAKWLERANLDVLQFTAGKWKRTIDPLTPPTEEAKAKMQEDIMKIHDAFKCHIVATRKMDVEGVATGEVFLGIAAKERGLVDELATSDEILASKMLTSDVIEVAPSSPKRGLVQLLESRLEALETLGARIWSFLPPSRLRGRIALETDDPKVN